MRPKTIRLAPRAPTWPTSRFAHRVRNRGDRRRPAANRFCDQDRDTDVSTRRRMLVDNFAASFGSAEPRDHPETRRVTHETSVGRVLLLHRRYRQPRPIKSAWWCRSRPADRWISSPGRLRSALPARLNADVIVENRGGAGGMHRNGTGGEISARRPHAAAGKSRVAGAECRIAPTARLRPDQILHPDRVRRPGAVGSRGERAIGVAIFAELLVRAGGGPCVTGPPDPAAPCISPGHVRRDVRNPDHPHSLSRWRTGH